MKKPLIVLLLAVLALAFFALDLHHFLTLDGLKASMGQLLTWQANSPLLVAAGYFVLYVLATALSLPSSDSSPQTLRSRVDLPGTDAPKRPTHSPAWRFKLTPSSACVRPNFFLSWATAIAGNGASDMGANIAHSREIFMTLLCKPLC